ncbi:hypothetical protein [Beijerinckia indica]|uniref:Uncharacterized protein n=1 Tax=Beijerinckia indica subsp. indica (strain ATCC 9039 / DSM 1715 / NCIMB 8712) TaxID=395963 RepID=B2IL80_BEII9|nr:hypothetical protein [Beijerinckia indica]ACB97280.1 hypothetical protein Bind_3728 [Beijerinckia indica subsp. indica ATCC 9039]
MTLYRLRLVEELIEGDTGEFIVEAKTPGDAASVLLTAHAEAREKDSNHVVLPDGQSQHIEPDNIIRTRLFCMLLDDDGNELYEIDPEA